MNNSNANKKVYLLGSRFNNMESILVQDNRASQLIYFNTFDLAKKCFATFYENLLSPSLQIALIINAIFYLHPFLHPILTAKHLCEVLFGAHYEFIIAEGFIGFTNTLSSLFIHLGRFHDAII